MRRVLLVASFCLVAAAQSARAQAPAPPAAPSPPPAAVAKEPGEAAKALISGGPWEFTNADRDKSCAVTFRADPSGTGMKVEFDRGCPGQFEFIRDVVAWSLAQGDFLRLLDAKGQSVLEFSEVESGVYEAPRPGEGILFIQAAGSAGPPPPTPEQIAGDWIVTRGAGARICGLTLTTTPSGEDLSLRLVPPCDALITRFAPTVWRMDGDELVLKTARGQTWRFEQSDEEEGAWRRLPESADPLLLKRK